MDRRAAIATYRAAFAILTIAAILTQLVDLSAKGTLDPFNYFSYFTIQSNLIATAVLLVGAARWRSAQSSLFDLVRGGAVVYMSVTGIVFTLLLSGTDVDTAIPWVNTVVHQLMPIVVVVDWLLDPPTARLTFRQGLLWLSYPAVWIVYILIRVRSSGSIPILSSTLPTAATAPSRSIALRSSRS
ncbi:MAG TPA: Pr6Pr family membrane protein [Candidatus Limnocylindrales bacterium]|nr:Pr6Pr family membrane protein [Candidatus Limnocylindrales bacterium]